jgi:class 3 adenylate cyclase
MHALPTGTITFLFTDIEGSTKLLQQLGDEYARILGKHQALLRTAFAAHTGVEVDTQGDAFFVAFPSAPQAVAAAADATRAWPRMPGPQAPHCGCAWGCTPARRNWSATTTSASTSTAPRASPPLVTAVR